MIRDLESLTSRNFDVVVVGGGIYGAAVAREAALCGLSTALIEKADFCSGTSANSLKIIHGGLRYLQQLDIPRLRNSVVERRALLRTAPHLVHPLPCMMPTQGHGMKGREAMFFGMLLNEILSLDRNQLSDQEKHIPRGNLISRDETCRRIPGLSPAGITGGATWHDAYVYNSERLVTGMIQGAVDAGAVAANYVTLTAFHKTNGRITAIRARDELTGNEFDISSRLVINTTGPWINDLLNLLDRRPSPPMKGLALGLNFVLRRQLLPQATGLRCTRKTGGGQRLLFLMPWRNHTVAGTYYRIHKGAADSMAVTEPDIETLLSDLTLAYPAAEFKREDISGVLAGLLPIKHERASHEEPALANHFSIIDHARQDSLEGLITVVGVKYTTARDVAARTISLVLEKLDCPARVSGTELKLLPGGQIHDFQQALSDARARAAPPLTAEVMDHLLYNFGHETRTVLDYGKNEPVLLDTLGPDTSVIGAEIIHAVRNEMAVTLPDAVFRRTDLGSAGLPGLATLKRCADIMASECGWTGSRRDQELAKVMSSPFFGDPLRRYLR